MPIFILSGSGGGGGGGSVSGSSVTGLTPQQVLFGTGGGVIGQATNLTWNGSGLSVGGPNPGSRALAVTGSVGFSGTFIVDGISTNGILYDGTTGRIGFGMVPVALAGRVQALARGTGSEPTRFGADIYTYLGYSNTDGYLGQRDVVTHCEVGFGTTNSGIVRGRAGTLTNHSFEIFANNLLVANFTADGNVLIGGSTGNPGSRRFAVSGTTGFTNTVNVENNFSQAQQAFGFPVTAVAAVSASASTAVQGFVPITVSGTQFLIPFYR
jgi:hypothetical protein